jgi:hypothetical protein
MLDLLPGMRRIRAFVCDGFSSFHRRKPPENANPVLTGKERGATISLLCPVKISDTLFNNLVR